MGIVGKINKVARWGKIWASQFVHVDNIHCEAGNGTVLVIKLDAIGDFLIWLDSAKEFKRLFPDKKIYLMCGNACVDIAKHTGYFDEVITLNIKKFETESGYRKEKISEMKKYKFDILIQTAFSRTIHMDILAASIPSHEKIGLTADESRSNLSRYITTKNTKKRLDSVYDRLIPVSSECMLEVRRNGELIKGLGKSDFLTGLPVLNKYEADEKIIPTDNYYVLFPGASTPKKMWNIERFAEVADYVYQKTGWTGYVCGSREEQYLFEQIIKSKAPDTPVTDYFGKTTLLELAEVIRNSRIVVSNDTSGIHFAAAVNAPSVCILGEYNYGRFLPYDYERTYPKDELKPMIVCHADMPCKRCATGKITAECNRCMAMTGRHLCVDKITVNQVKEAVDKILNI